jgi:hypothetical protein
MRKVRVILAAALATGIIVLSAPTPAPATGEICVDLLIFDNDPDPICIPVP